jgi:hypothetical protein
MAFNPLQFKQKKKRVMDPTIPRPNLFSHEKKLKEQTQAFDRLLQIIDKQQLEINSLKNKYTDLQQSIGQILNLINRR